MTTALATRTRSGGRTNTAPARGDDPNREILRAALGFQEISVDIPTTATLEQVSKTLGIAIEGYKRLQNGIERIKPIIGRILYHIEQTKVFRPAHKNFTAFIDTVVVGEMGFGRTTAFEALRIARAFPHLSMDEYQNYGATRLLAAARITDESKPDYKDTLARATQVTAEDFITEVASTIAAGRPSSETVTATLRLQPEVKVMWEQMLESTGQTANDLLKSLLEMFKAQAKKHIR